MYKLVERFQFSASETESLCDLDFFFVLVLYNIYSSFLSSLFDRWEMKGIKARKG